MEVMEKTFEELLEALRNRPHTKLEVEKQAKDIIDKFFVSDKDYAKILVLKKSIEDLRAVESLENKRYYDTIEREIVWQIIIKSAFDFGSSFKDHDARAEIFAWIATIGVPSLFNEDQILAYRCLNELLLGIELSQERAKKILDCNVDSFVNLGKVIEFFLLQNRNNREQLVWLLSKGLLVFEHKRLQAVLTICLKHDKTIIIDVLRYHYVCHEKDNNLGKVDQEELLASRSVMRFFSTQRQKEKLAQWVITSHRKDKLLKKEP